MGTQHGAGTPGHDQPGRKQGSGAAPSAISSSLAPARKLGLLGLTSIIYLIVSGGAYGMEDAVRTAGPRLALLLCLLVPLTLSLPTALMAAELNALMPVEGGFYFWVKEALGPFAGFAEAYLTFLYTAVDMAIYPVMFTAYLAFLCPLGTGGQIAVGIALVWIAGLLNLLGVRPTGTASVVLAVLLTLPFAALVIVGFGRLVHWQAPAGHIFGPGFAGALGSGLTVVIWNFSGWENATVVAGEIRDAGRTYLRALMIALPLVVIGYLLPLGVTVSGVHSWANWKTGWFTTEGYRMGGMALGAALALGGTLSSFAIFEAAMLWVSRMPYVLAGDGYLPPSLAKLWSTTETPSRSIFACCVLFTLLVPLGFTALVVLDVFFYMGALVLEMGALIRMRRKRPTRDGLFVIGGGRVGVWTVALAPMLTWCATFGLALAQGGAQIDFMIALVLAVTTYPAYVLCRRIWGGPPALEEVAGALSAEAAALR